MPLSGWRFGPVAWPAPSSSDAARRSARVSASSLIVNAAMLDTWSPSPTRITVTPCVLRPSRLIVSTSRADDHAIARNQHELLAGLDDAAGGDIAGAVGDVERLHALAATALDGVLAEARALAEAAFRDREQLVAIVNRLHADDVAALRELHATHAATRAAGFAQVIDLEADGLARARNQEHMALVCRQPGRDELVAGVQAHGNLAVAPDLFELLQRASF